jgi:hypothetical protein
MLHSTVHKQFYVHPFKKILLQIEKFINTLSRTDDDYLGSSMKFGGKGTLSGQWLPADCWLVSWLVAD